MPNVIADFIGDNVNDIAGNCSDLLESFVATTAAGILIASTLFASGELSSSSYGVAMMYPVILAGGGLLGCLLGLLIIQLRKMGDNSSKELNGATYVSASPTLLFGLGSCFLLLSFVSTKKMIQSYDCTIRGVQKGGHLNPLVCFSSKLSCLHETESFAFFQVTTL